MSTGAWVVLVAVVAALAFGGYRLLTDGRFRGTRGVGGRAASTTDAGDRASGVDDIGGRAADVGGRVASASERIETPWSLLTAAVPAAELGERATLLQFSSAFCAPCRATRRTLTDVAGAVPGVAHVEVDAEHHLDLVRALGILRTPTTLVLDSVGREVTRATGAPRKEQVLAALGWA
ncbi:TlpA family protein disulfide reductase [Nocardioides sp. URHA0032]|uniref:TlpA family protein disulfide reductase n=1 Tax=Nocardioides sp. URHA0032 TaxID=1380388 RepID=UPI000491909C|nr:thioredoxin family protein [Nocardioides sp. URHA0032]